MGKILGFEFTLNVLLICLVVSIGGFLFGYDTGLVSGLLRMKHFVADFGAGASDGELPYWIESLMVGVPSLGMFLGAISSGPLGDRVGRRSGITYANVLFFIGVIPQSVTSHSLSLFVISRFITGLGIGMLSGLVPLYQAECSPRKIRGALIATYQFAITIGIEMSNVVNYATKGIDGSSSYRIPIVLQLLFSGLLSLGLLRLPESPRYLLLKGEDQKAVKSLLYINNEKSPTRAIQAELSELTTEIKRERTFPPATYSSLFKGTSLRRILIAMGSQVFQQFTGVNFIFYFGVGFFKMAGVGDPYLAAVIVGLVNVLANIPGIYLVEDLGRRKLLMAGAVVMAIPQLVIGTLGLAGPMTPPKGIAVVILSCVFVAGFSISWGIGAWIVCTEVFNQAQRSKGNSVAVSMNWLSNTLIAFTIPVLVSDKSLGLGARIGILWAVTNTLAFLFVYFFVPETKGLSLEFITYLFDEGTSARDTSKWRAPEDELVLDAPPVRNRSRDKKSSSNVTGLEETN